MSEQGTPTSGVRRRRDRVKETYQSPASPLVMLRSVTDPRFPTFVGWVAWIDKDGEGHGVDRLYAGRVKLQDDPIATAHAVLYDALQKLETTLRARDGQDPLF